MNSSPNAVKWLYFHYNFQKFPGGGGGACPWTLPKEVPPSAVAFSVVEKNPLFPKSVTGSTE